MESGPICSEGINSVTRLGDLSPIGRLFEVLGDNIFDLSSPIFWRLFGRFFTEGPKPSFLCYKNIFNIKKCQNLAHFCREKVDPTDFLGTVK